MFILFLLLLTLHSKVARHGRNVDRGLFHRAAECFIVDKRSVWFQIIFDTRHRLQTLPGISNVQIDEEWSVPGFYLRQRRQPLKIVRIFVWQ